MPLVAWAAYLFLAGSILFAIGATTWLVAGDEGRKGPDPNGQRHLDVLAQDPLVSTESEAFTRTGQRDVIGNYICPICDYFPTGILQGFQARQEPSRALGMIESAAGRSGWTVVGRDCQTDPGVASLTVEKNFDEFHTEALFKVSVGVETGETRMHSRFTIEDGTHRIRRGSLEPADCLDDRWRAPGSGSEPPQQPPV